MKPWPLIAAPCYFRYFRDAGGAACINVAEVAEVAGSARATGDDRSKRSRLGHAIPAKRQPRGGKLLQVWEKMWDAIRGAWLKS